MRTSAKDVSASNHSGASSTTAGFVDCRCCWKRRRRKAARKVPSTWIASMNGTSRSCAAFSLPDLPDLAEHLRLKPPHLRALFPGVARQAGLVTRLRKKRLAIPVPLGRHLRQQQPAVPTHFDDEAVTPDGDVVGTGDRLERTEERELEIERRQFYGGDGREARIRAAGGDGTTRDHVAEWLVHLHVPDAAAELTVVV